MLNLKKKVLNFFIEFQERLNGVSGKLKLRTIYIFVSVFTLIIFVRIVSNKKFMIFNNRFCKITNLNPQFISELSSKYSDRMSSKEAFLIASTEIFSMLEIRILNVVRTINVISEILKRQESKGFFVYLCRI